MTKPSSSSSSFVSISILPVLFVFCVAVNGASVSKRPVEVTSLLSLKSSLKDPLNTFQDWNDSSSDWCSWSGIECDNVTGVVTGVDLSGRSLSGSVPDYIRNLVHLRRLNLSGNALGGGFPPAIFQLQALRSLDINHNNFSSVFPAGISRLHSLTYFDAFSNNFTGPLPEDIARLRNLEHLNLGGSYFDGEIPASYGSFPKLKFLFLAGNLLTGPIPPELGLLTQLQHFQLGSNQYTAGIPPEFGSLSNLLYLDIQSANLSGTLPPELGNLNKLEYLIIYNNSFTGPIPPELGNLTSLKELDLSDNFISGSIPASLSSLGNLRLLSLMYNDLTGEIPEGLSELPELQLLNLWSNSLSGNLPQRFGSNGKLQKFDVSSNSLTGPIPPHLCHGNRLEKLILFGNHLAGELPESLVSCSTLVRIRIQNNDLNGSFPRGFGFLSNLTLLDISRNRFTGRIPEDFGNPTGNLVSLNVSHNSFGGALPGNIWHSRSLQIFSASDNKLAGEIPEFKGCKEFSNIELQGNNLSGSIPWSIEHCEKLILLNLRRNSLSGIIPWEISGLPKIADVDLSYNFLSGSIPSNFGNCRTLESFNVSYNRLEGPIPSSSSLFTTLHPSSFFGNKGLCGKPVQKPCQIYGPAASDSPDAKNRRAAGPAVWLGVVVFGMCFLIVLVAGTRWARARRGTRVSGHGDDAGPWKLTAFRRLNFTASDVLECVAMSDEVVGMGSTGVVYKAEMPGGETIAVKKLILGRQRKKKRGGVLAEVDVLGSVRHRNIVRLLGYCTSGECTMLLYEYMPNGNLHDLLHSNNKVREKNGVDWMTRYKIAVGVAQGMSYLHHDCNPVIVHRDLKPSNILLDPEMEARVADFGVAKLLLQTQESSSSLIAGSYGYIAPEYAYTLQFDEKSDIYSYGVVLLEILTGKRSVESEFGEGNSVVDWVRSKLTTTRKHGGTTNKQQQMEVFDKNIMGTSTCPDTAAGEETMMLLLKVALLCTCRNPADRPSMRDVVSMLQAAMPKVNPKATEVEMNAKMEGENGNNNIINNGAPLVAGGVCEDDYLFSVVQNITF
ncbi:unnamed protein product [Cuscuta campestris]|uniref:non-specific serine/threonine protein kinase n=1 Tax=Cuscuta campestris TaxID=132261 RepID=A0A484LVK4_9ASTE|nr:unnamed protein product [Cuscuta campestris]